MQTTRGIGIWTGLIFLASFFWTGCSSFHRQWKQAAAVPPPAEDIYGRWEGRWISDVNGHNGRLRCIITKLNENEYEARFHAKYRRVLSFGYTVPLNVSQREEKYLFEGEADLGWWAGGVYHYDGWATPKEFFSTYRSKHDHGEFHMTRPGGKNGEME